MRWAGYYLLASLAFTALYIAAASGWPREIVQGWRESAARRQAA